MGETTTRQKTYNKIIFIIAILTSLFLGIFIGMVGEKASQKNPVRITQQNDPMPNYQPLPPPVTTYEAPQSMEPEEGIDPHITLNIQGSVNAPITIVCGKGTLTQHSSLVK